MARADIERIVRETAGEYKFPEVDVLLATVHQESGFRPDAVGDQGNSRGIFQENVRGRGAGLSPEQSFDPRASTVRAIQEFNRYRSRGSPPATGRRPRSARRDRQRLRPQHQCLVGPGAGPLTDRSARTTRPGTGSTWPSRRPAARTSPQDGPAGRRRRRPRLVQGRRRQGPRGGAGQAAPPEGGRRGGRVWPVVGQKPGAVNNPFGAGQARAAGTTVAAAEQQRGGRPAGELRGHGGGPGLRHGAGGVRRPGRARPERRTTGGAG